MTRLSLICFKCHQIVNSPVVPIIREKITRERAFLRHVWSLIANVLTTHDGDLCMLVAPFIARNQLPLLFPFNDRLRPSDTVSRPWQVNPLLMVCTATARSVRVFRGPQTTTIEVLCPWVVPENLAREIELIAHAGILLVLNRDSLALLNSSHCGLNCIVTMPIVWK